MRKLRSNLRVVTALVLLLGGGNGFADSVSVSVQELGKSRIDPELRAPASVLSANDAIVTAQISALIEHVHADVGASVSKGELLITLDNANARFSLAQAEADLGSLDAQIEEAAHRLAKVEKLLDRNYVSDDELTERRTRVAVLEANRQRQLVAIQQAELELSRTRIRAPFAATVTRRDAQVGSFAQPGTPLLSLVQTDEREIDAEIDPRHGNQIDASSGVRFESMGQSYEIELLRMSDVIESDSRRVRARFQFIDESAPIGASGEIVWQRSTGMVPADLVVKRGSDYGIFIASDGLAEFVRIADAQEGRPAELDLPDNTPIVVRGHTRLQHGDKLTFDR